MKLITRIITLSILSLLLFSVAVFAGTPILYDKFDSGGDAFHTITGTYHHMTQFNATANYTVTKYGVYIRRDGTPGAVNNYWIILKHQTPGSDNFSDGGVVLSADNYIWNNLSTNYEWKYAVPSLAEAGSNGIQLIAGDNYSVELRYPSGVGGVNEIEWHKEGSSDNGFRNWLSDDGGTTYTLGAVNTDLYFRVYGTTEPAYLDTQETGDDGHAGVWTVSDSDNTTGLYYWCNENDNYYYVWNTDNLSWLHVGYCPGAGIGGADIQILDTVDESLESVLGLWGMDNSAGHWITILILLIFTTFIFRHNRFLQIAAAVAVFGFGIATGWIATWVVILLSIIFAVIVTMFLSGKRHATE